ncbi:hypothetical protein OR1_02615 [Geobacter sp. OR-1]|nr:hypothetical protein OR1_02615 [Geobacter sp. OR-1]
MGGKLHQQKQYDLSLQPVQIPHAAEGDEVEINSLSLAQIFTLPVLCFNSGKHLLCLAQIRMFREKREDGTERFFIPPAPPIPPTECGNSNHQHGLKLQSLEVFEVVDKRHKTCSRDQGLSGLSE